MPNPENVVPYGKHNHLMAQYGGPESYDQMVYNFGFEDGQHEGYSTGYNDGHDNGRSIGFLDGFDVGHQQGLTKGGIIVAIASLALCGLSHYVRTKWQERKAQLNTSQTTTPATSSITTPDDSNVTTVNTNPVSPTSIEDDTGYIEP
ncbi:MAG: hypothetical protein J6I89_07780 [Oscillospiraceae bacterium]|nr:hypothetical protein [Oscillospiraceae bacterium]